MRHLALVSVLLVATASGCATTSSGRDFSVDAVRAIKRGDSKQRVVELLGQPGMRNVAAPGSEQWTYSFTESSGRVNPLVAVPIFGAFAGGTAEGRFKTVTVSFEENMVSKCQFSIRVTRQGGVTAFDTKDQGSGAYSAPCGAIEPAEAAR